MSHGHRNGAWHRGQCLRFASSDSMAKCRHVLHIRAPPLDKIAWKSQGSEEVANTGKIGIFGGMNVNRSRTSKTNWGIKREPPRPA